jgi:hypothetical protein
MPLDLPDRGGEIVHVTSRTQEHVVGDIGGVFGRLVRDWRRQDADVVWPPLKEHTYCWLSGDRRTIRPVHRDTFRLDR